MAVNPKSLQVGDVVLYGDDGCLEGEVMMVQEDGIMLRTEGIDQLWSYDRWFWRSAELQTHTIL